MSNKPQPLIQIVDEHDNLLRGGTMDEVQLGGLWHRIARMMVYDTSKQLYLLQKIAPNPYYNGGLWNTSVSGHVDEGESYEEAVVREAWEEMGLTDLDTTEIDRYKTEQQKGERLYRRHNVTFLAAVEQTPQVIPGSEVEAIWWLSKDELLELDEELMSNGLKRFVHRIIEQGQSLFD